MQFSYLTWQHDHGLNALENKACATEDWNHLRYLQIPLASAIFKQMFVEKIAFSSDLQQSSQSDDLLPRRFMNKIAKSKVHLVGISVQHN